MGLVGDGGGEDADVVDADVASLSFDVEGGEGETEGNIVAEPET